ncbi:MAG: DUF971 domain-containing protein [Melioribacteraceae bacterium]
MIPVKIKLKESESLYVKWDDHSESEISLSNLRRFCPCAICASLEEDHPHDTIKVFTDEQLSIQDLQIVGNYAVSVRWGDNHNTGIYDFSCLRRISEL